MSMTTGAMRDLLLRLAEAVREHTEAGLLTWRRTNDSPREYYVSVGEMSALAIRRVRFERRVEEQLVSPYAGAVAAMLQPRFRTEHVTDYQLLLLSPSGDELASLSARVKPDPPDALGVLLEGLFQAAELSSEPVQEAVEDALKALQKAS